MLYGLMRLIGLLFGHWDLLKQLKYQIIFVIVKKRLRLSVNVKTMMTLGKAAILKM